MNAKLKREVIQALRDAAMHGAGNWEHLVQELEREPVECNEYPCCPCESKADCMQEK